MHVPVGRPLLGDIEKEYVDNALVKGEISGFSGNYIGDFEKAFATFCGTSDAVTVSSGTAALHLALEALHIGGGDEVIASSFTNMATFFAIMYTGATPVAIDSEPETLNIDPSRIEERITPKTKAILVVHIYGQPADMDPILALAKKYNLYVIEDAAEAHGAEYKGKKTGSLGDIGCFSFYANKIVTTGEGGMLTMNDPALAERARSLKALSFGKDNKFMHQDIGYNYRMTNLQAAVGAAQMTRIDDILARKQAMAAYYRAHLSGIDGLRLPIELPDTRNVWWMYNLRLEGPLLGKRGTFMEALQARGVECREDFIPFNDQTIFIDRGLTQVGDCPVASEAGREGFYIPSGTDISEEEQAYVCDQVRSIAAELS